MNEEEFHRRVGPEIVALEQELQLDLPLPFLTNDTGALLKCIEGLMVIDFTKISSLLHFH
jgi:hypothetical protein